MTNIDYEGEHRSLRTSYKCPIGSIGSPGPIGFEYYLILIDNYILSEPGEDGTP